MSNRHTPSPHAFCSCRLCPSATRTSSMRPSLTLSTRAASPLQRLQSNSSDWRGGRILAVLAFSSQLYWEGERCITRWRSCVMAGAGSWPRSRYFVTSGGLSRGADSVHTWWRACREATHCTYYTHARVGAKTPELTLGERIGIDHRSNISQGRTRVSGMVLINGVL